MTYLKNKYSNSQIYGFFGLFLTNAILTYYAIAFVKIIPHEKDVLSYLYDMIPMFGVYVGIPLVVSFLISYRLYKHKMLSRSNYFILLLIGFLVSLIFWVSDYFLLLD